MTDPEYLQTQTTLLHLARMTIFLDMDSFLSRIGTAHAIGPIKNPTLYREAMGNLEQIERIARAAAEFKKVAVKALGEMGKPEEQGGGQA